MCIRKKVFGPPPLIHNNYTGNVGLQIWVILTLIVPVTWTTFRIEFCVFPLLWPLRLIFSPAISIICPIFCVQGHFGKGRFNHCLVVFTDLIRTTVCVLRSLQEKVWTSGNQNGRPWNTFFFFPYSCRPICVPKSEALAGFVLTMARSWSYWGTNSVSSDVVHTDLLNVS